MNTDPYLYDACEILLFLFEEAEPDQWLTIEDLQSGVIGEILSKEEIEETAKKLLFHGFLDRVDNQYRLTKERRKWEDDEGL